MNNPELKAKTWVISWTVVEIQPYHYVSEGLSRLTLFKYPKLNSTIPATGLMVVLSNIHAAALATHPSSEWSEAVTYSTKSWLLTPNLLCLELIGTPAQVDYPITSLIVYLG